MAAGNGLVAVLDALGAKNYTPEEVQRFLNSREVAINATQDKASENLVAFDPKKFQTFLFNDTIVFVYLDASLAAIESFCHVMRVFTVLSMTNGILFRGAFSIGEFFTATNTVMGPALTDAAEWYEKSDWIGIHATPHATIQVSALLEPHPAGMLDHVLVDYLVPMKDKSTRTLKAINWPKGFFIRDVAPRRQSAKSALLGLLAQHRIPLGTESKYFNSIEFFDTVITKQGLGPNVSATKSRPSAPNHK